MSTEQHDILCSLISTTSLSNIQDYLLSFDTRYISSLHIWDALERSNRDILDIILNIPNIDFTEILFDGHIIHAIKYEKHMLFTIIKNKNIDNDIERLITIEVIDCAIQSNRFDFLNYIIINKNNLKVTSDIISRFTFDLNNYFSTNDQVVRSIGNQLLNKNIESYKYNWFNIYLEYIRIYDESLYLLINKSVYKKINKTSSIIII